MFRQLVGENHTLTWLNIGANPWSEQYMVRKILVLLCLFGVRRLDPSSCSLDIPAPLIYQIYLEEVVRFGGKTGLHMGRIYKDLRCRLATLSRMHLHLWILRKEIRDGQYRMSSAIFEQDPVLPGSFRRQVTNWITGLESYQSLYLFRRVGSTISLERGDCVPWIHLY